MMKKMHINSLMFKIVSTVILGCLTLATLLSAVNFSISKDIFMSNFAQSQSKIFSQIDKDYYAFYSDIADIMSFLRNSNYLKTYFLNYNKSDLSEMNTIYGLQQSVKKTPIGKYDDINVFVVDNNKKSYIFSSNIMVSTNIDNIWESDVAKYARANAGKIVSKYEKIGFTNVTKKVPVVVFAKAWAYNYDDTVDTIAFVTIKESDIRNMYSYFASSASDIILLNEENEVISSNNVMYLQNNSELVTNLSEQINYMLDNDAYRNDVVEDRVYKTYFMQRLQNTNYKIIGVINLNKAFSEEYEAITLVIPTIVITSIIVLLISVFVRQQTKPIRKLVKIMSNSSKEHFKKRVPVKGTYEVKELSKTYNNMVDELDEHIKKLIQVEKDKRLTEIYALQMQINPHYMYNTLSSIKWLVWKGDQEKTIKVIDAFIQLLRNVIGNTDECVTVEHEIENLKNYCLVNRARYGDSISVEFFIMQKCLKYEIPKLILQPIVENTFFHAFPEGGKGNIEIFLKEEAEDLRFDIVDNGVGIKKERLDELNNNKLRKRENFTGIGINNVDNRLKLLYGQDYGITINATEGEGTTVTIKLPKRRKE